MLAALTSNKDCLQAEIFSLLNKNRKLGRAQEVDKCLPSVIHTSKILTKQFDEYIITQEILLTSFTFIDDQVKEILSKFNVTYDLLLKEIKKFRKGKSHE